MNTGRHCPQPVFGTRKRRRTVPDAASVMVSALASSSDSGRCANLRAKVRHAASAKARCRRPPRARQQPRTVGRDCDDIGWLTRGAQRPCGPCERWNPPMSAGVGRMNDTEFQGDPENPRLIGTEGGERNRPCTAQRGDGRIRFQIQMPPFPAAQPQDESARGAAFASAPAPLWRFTPAAAMLARITLPFGFATRGFGSEEEHRADDEAGHEHQEQPDASRRRALVLPHKPAGAITDARAAAR